MFEDQALALLEGREYTKVPLLSTLRQILDWKLTGVLPHEGGTLDQDPEFMRDLRIFRSLEAQVEKKNLALADIKRKLPK